MAFLNLGTHHQRGAARVAGAELADRLRRRLGALHHDGVGQLAQHRRHRRARPGRHRDQAGDRAQHALALALQQRRGAVAAGQADRECVDPRPPVGALLLHLALAGHQLRDPGPGALVRLDGLRGARGEAGVAVVGVAEGLAGGLQLGLGDGRALLRLGERLREAFDLLRGGGGPAAQGLGPAGQGGQPGPAVGQGPDRSEMGALGGGEGALVVGALLGDAGETLPGLLDRRDEQLLLLGGGVGLGVELVGIAAGRARLTRVGEVAGALLREPDGAVEPFRERREPVPGVLRGGEARRVLGEGGLQPLLLDAGDGQLLLHLGATGAGLRLVGLLLGELVPQRHQVVGGQPQPGVAQLGLHGLGPARDLRLPAQRLELTAQLAGEVGQTGEVGLHRVELAEGLLFPLPVLEDARGLLDVGAAVLGLALQHRVELALPDDDVHLAADAGVAQQLLDVEQPGTVAVDLVLARAVAEHPTGDRHLGVVDGQRAVGVVDGQGHLGAAQGGAAGRAGEDDVLHLAAAQRLGPLLTEHPADGVHDVGLARPVGPDHARDTGFQAQRRGRGEGLEALQRQALEVHGSPRDGRGSLPTRPFRPPRSPSTGRWRRPTAPRPRRHAPGWLPHSAQPGAAHRQVDHPPRRPRRAGRGGSGPRRRGRARGRGTASTSGNPRPAPVRPPTR